MKFLSCSLLVLTLVISSVGASARGTATGTVTKITAGSNNINIFLSVEVTPVTDESLPVCSETTQQMVLNPEDKTKLAILLTAKALGSSVKMVGTGTCTVKPTVETISFIQVLD